MSSRKHKNASQKPYLPFIERPVMGIAEGQDLHAIAKVAREKRAFFWPFETQAPSVAYVDQSNRWGVQVWDELDAVGNAFAGTLRVAFKYCGVSGDPGSQAPIQTWETIQQIKEHLWPGRMAVEVYPTVGQAIATDGVRWLWVLPAGAGPELFPFSLSGKPRAI